MEDTARAGENWWVALTAMAEILPDNSLRLLVPRAEFEAKYAAMKVRYAKEAKSLL